MTILEAGAALRAKKVSSVELVQEGLRIAEKLQPKLNAFITFTKEQALKRAGELDAELASGRDRGPMHGIPIGLKDLLNTRGVRTTNGSKLFENRVPDHDAKVVTMLEEAGAVSLGKLGLHELAYGITSNNPWFGAVRNPWNPECIPGGSSGGSGAAVATGMTMMAVGTDTGGSIRIPAAFCGTCGIKPTYGIVPVDGAMPLGFSLDTIGPLAKSVRDTAVSFEAFVPGKKYLPTDAEISLKGIRIGVPENFFFDHVDPAVDKAVHAAATVAQEAGAELVSVRVEHMEDLVTVGRMILLVEAADAVGDYWPRRSEFGADVLSLFDQGRLIPAPHYVRAQRLRVELTRRFLQVFAKCDCILAPANAMGAPKIGQTSIDIAGKPQDVRLASTRLVRGINVLGLPALSQPCGFTDEGLPIGLQLIGRAHEEALLFRAGAAIEDRTEHHKRSPAL